MAGPNKLVLQPRCDPWEPIDPREASYEPDRLINATLSSRQWEMILWSLDFSANVLAAFQAKEDTRVTELRQAADDIESSTDPEAGGGRWVDPGYAIALYRVGNPMGDHIAEAQAMDDADERDKLWPIEEDIEQEALDEAALDLDSRCTCPMSVRESMERVFSSGGMTRPDQLAGPHHSRGCPMYQTPEEVHDSDTRWMEGQNG